MIKRSQEIIKDSLGPGWAFPNSLIAGYVAGVCGTIIGHPFDSLKVLLQTRWATGAVVTSSSSSSSYPMSFGFSKTPSRNIVSVSSSSPQPTLHLRSLYAGVSGPLLTVGLIQCINFSIYDSCRQYLYYSSPHVQSSHNYLYHDSLFHVGLSSFISGGIVSFITSPLSIIKTKQQIMCWDFQRAFMDTLGTHSSWSKFFLGFGPHFICESFGRSAYLCTYEYLKRCCIRLQHPGDRDPDHPVIPLWQRMICAAMSGITSWSVIFPLDVIRSRMYFESISGQLSSSDNTAKSTFSMIQHMYRDNGNKMGIFFRGYGVTIVRAGPVAAVVLPVYDQSLDFLRRRYVEQEV